MVRPKKGFIFTFDAILGLLVAAIVITSTVLYISSSGNLQMSAKQNSMQAADILAVAEKSGMLKEWADTTNSSEIREYLSIIPSSRCVNMTLYDQNYVLISSVQNKPCVSDNTRYAARRVFIATDKTAYVAEVSMMYP